MPRKIIYEDAVNPITIEVWARGMNSVFIQMIEKNTQGPDEFITIELTKEDIKTLIEDLETLIA